MKSKLIEELAEQALKSSMIHDGVYRPEGCANGVSKNFADKFAELIVRECANKVTKELSVFDIDGYFLLKYFGVEE